MYAQAIKTDVRTVKREREKEVLKRISLRAHVIQKIAAFNIYSYSSKNRVMLSFFSFVFRTDRQITKNSTGNRERERKRERNIETHLVTCLRNTLEKERGGRMRERGSRKMKRGRE